MSNRPYNKGYIRGSYMTVSYDAPPLDFSFKDIESLNDLLFEKQRKGRNKDRKPIIELKDDKKKKGQKEDEKAEFGVDSVDGGADEKDGDQNDEDGEDGEEKKKEEEHVVHKLIPPSTHMNLANAHNISLAPNQVFYIITFITN